MSLPPLKSIPLILRPQAWLHRRHYGEVLSPIRWCFTWCRCSSAIWNASVRPSIRC